MKVIAKLMMLTVVMGFVAIGIGVSEPESPAQKPADSDNPVLKIPDDTPYYVREQIELLQSDDYGLQRDAARNLGLMGREAEVAVPFLMERLDVETFTSRKDTLGIAIVVALGEIGGERAVEYLVQLHGKWMGSYAKAALNDALKRNPAITFRLLSERIIKYGGNKDVTNLLIDIHQPAVAPLIEALKKANAQGRQCIIYVLQEIRDPRAVEPIVAMLKDEDRGVRSAAALSLQYFGDKRAVKPLLEALHDKDYYTKVYALASLRILGDPSIASAIIEIAADPDISDRAVKEQAILILGDLKAESAVELLSGLVDDREKEIAQAAAWALGEIANNDALLKLIEAAKKGNLFAIDALGRIDDARAADELAALVNPDSKQGRRAALALAEHGDKRAFEALAKMAGDYKQAKQAVNALLKLNDPRSTEVLVEYSNGGIYPEIEDMLIGFGKPAVDIIVQMLRKEASWSKEAMISIVRILNKMPSVEAAQALAGVMQKDPELARPILTFLAKNAALVPAKALMDAYGSLRYDSYKTNALEILGDIGDPAAIDFLIETAKSRERDVRSAAVEALAKIGGQKVIKYFMDFCYSRRCPAHENAIAKIGVPLMEELLKKFAVAKYGRERDLTIKLFAQIDDDRARKIVKDVLKGESLQERRRAIEGLSLTANPALLPALLKTAREEDEHYTGQMLLEAVCVNGQASPQVLLDALRGDDNGAKALAARALGIIGEKRAVSDLVKLLSAEDRNVAVSAGLGLCAMDWTTDDKVDYTNYLLAIFPVVLDKFCKERYKWINKDYAKQLYKIYDVQNSSLWIKSELCDGLDRDALIVAMDSPLSEQRRFAARMLINRGDMGALKFLKELALTASYPKNFEAVLALAEKHDKSMVEPLFKIATMSIAEGADVITENENKVKATCLLAEFKDKRALELAINLLVDVAVNPKNYGESETYGGNGRRLDYMTLKYRGDNPIRELLRKVIADFGDAGRKPLLQALKKEHCKSNEEIVRLLARLKDGKISLELCEYPDKEVRLLAMKMLNQDNPDELATLFGMLADKDRDISDAALKTIRWDARPDLKPENARKIGEVLRGMLKDKKRNAGKAMALLASMHYVPATRDLIRALDGDRKYAAIAALAVMGTDEAGEVLLKALDTDDHRVQLEVLKALRAMKYAKANAKLWEVMDSPNRQVAEEALRALAAIGDTSLVDAIIATATQPAGTAPSGNVKLIPDKAWSGTAEALAMYDHSVIIPKMLAIITSKTQADYRHSREQKDMRLAESTLTNIGEPAINPLIGILRDADGKVRSPVARLLIRFALRGKKSPELASALVGIYGLEERNFKDITSALYQLGPYAFEDLIAMLQNEKEETRKLAAGILKNRKLPELTEPLLKVLKNKNWRIRRDAIVLLCEQCDARALEALIDLVLHDDHAVLRSLAIQSVGGILTKWEFNYRIYQGEEMHKIKDYRWRYREEKPTYRGDPQPCELEIGRKYETTYQKFTEQMQRLLKDPSPAKRHAAVLMLGRSRIYVKPILLIDALKDQDPGVRAAVAQMADSTKAEAIAQCLQDKNSYVASQAVAALQRFGIRTVGQTAKMFQSPDPVVRARAAEVMLGLRMKSVRGRPRWVTSRNSNRWREEEYNAYLTVLTPAFADADPKVRRLAVSAMCGWTIYGIEKHNSSEDSIQIIKRHIEFFISCLEDPDLKVRYIAHKELMKIFGRVGPCDPWIHRDPAFWRAMLAKRLDMMTHEYEKEKRQEGW